MVDAGRLETVPNHQSLYRLGGVIRQLSQEAGIEWPRAKPGSGLLDPRVGFCYSWVHASPYHTSDLKVCTGWTAGSTRIHIRSLQITLHLFQPHQAHQMFDPQLTGPS